MAAFIHRRATAILLVAAALTALAVLTASKLRLDQELRSLLPNDFPSVTRLDELSSRLGQQSDLYVTIRSPSRESNIAFGEAVAAKLGERDDIRYVVFRRDLSYFEERALLYASLGDLLDLRRRVIVKIREEVRKQAFGDFSDPEKPAESKEKTDLGFSPDEVREKYGLTEAYEEYAEADEGRLMVVKMRPIRPATDLEYAQGLTADVQRVVEELDPTAYHAEMTTELNGAYVQHQKRLKSVQQEVWAGTAAAVAALLLTLALYFRSPRAILLVFGPLLAAVTGALAFAYVVFDALNLVSAFIFAVLVGLGIDFGIHVLARLRQERSRGLSSEEALAVTLRTSGKTTAAGALSTAFAFAALSVADFQGFSQFGQVAAVGVVLSLTGALVVMPALMVALDRIRPWAPPPAGRGDPASLGKGGRGLRLAAIAVAVVGLGAAIYGGSHVMDLEFEHNLKKLGRRPNPNPGPKRANYRDAVGAHKTVDPAIVLVDDGAQALSVQRQLEALHMMTAVEAATFDPSNPPTRALPPPPKTIEDDLEELDLGSDDDSEWDDDEFGDDIEEFGDKDLEDPKFLELERRAEAEAVMSAETAELLGRYDPVRLVAMDAYLARVWSIHGFVPRLQAEKLEVIADIRKRIDAKRASFSKSTKEQVAQWYPYLAVDGPVTIAALPDWVRAQFEDTQGSPERSVVVATTGSKARINDSRGIYAAYGTLETPDGPVELAADFFVIPEIFDAIEDDGPVVMSLAIGIMLVTALVLLRRLGAVFAVAATIAFALLWLAGLMYGLGWKLNFFNIIVLPLLLGMGQDDALHIAERHHEEPGRLGRVLREAGGAIFITTLTTIWGFSGILFANHLGLNSMAWTAVAGMSLALVASVVVLPILLEFGRKLARRAS